MVLKRLCIYQIRTQKLSALPLQDILYEQTRSLSHLRLAGLLGIMFPSKHALAVAHPPTLARTHFSYRLARIHAGWLLLDELDRFSTSTLSRSIVYKMNAGTYQQNRKRIIPSTILNMI